MKGWKTVLLGVALLLLAAFNDPAVQEFVKMNLPECQAGLGVLVLVLRGITSSAIFKKE